MPKLFGEEKGAGGVWKTSTLLFFTEYKWFSFLATQPEINVFFFFQSITSSHLPSLFQTRRVCSEGGWDCLGFLMLGWTWYRISLGVVPVSGIIPMWWMRPLLWLDCQTLLTAPSWASVITRLPWGCWFPNLPSNRLIWSTPPHMLLSVFSPSPVPTLPNSHRNVEGNWKSESRGELNPHKHLFLSTALSQHAAHGSVLTRYIIFLRLKRRVNSRAWPCESSLQRYHCYYEKHGSRWLIQGAKQVISRKFGISPIHNLFLPKNHLTHMSPMLINTFKKNTADTRCRKPVIKETYCINREGLVINFNTITDFFSHLYLSSQHTVKCSCADVYMLAIQAVACVFFSNYEIQLTLWNIIRTLCWYNVL